MRDPVVAAGLAALILAGIFAAYPVTLLAVAGVVIVWLLTKALNQQAAHAAVQRDRNAATAARADHQHQQVMDGDPAGIYGRYTPFC